jgi:cysteinyl-tRNA synthetase
MSAKYLGEFFDIHGGGMDLLFPHHECEIAQSKAAHKHTPAKYWVHHNMITINGQKMAKSLNNGIKVEELFTGKHVLLSRGFGPATLRFFVLQAHYRGTLDFSEEALLASDKGLARLVASEQLIDGLKISEVSSVDFSDLVDSIKDALNDDLNTPIVIAQLFEAARRVNLVNDGKETIDLNNKEMVNKLFQDYFRGVLGIPSNQDSNNDGTLDSVLKLLIELRSEAKMSKNYALSDQIRNKLKESGIELMDSKEGTSWKKA